MTPPTQPKTVHARARQSRGTSRNAVYALIASTAACRRLQGTVLDVGCGTGNLFPQLRHMFTRYIGADVIRYDGLPEEVEFVQVDLDSGRVAMPDGVADLVIAAETIEHLENPRALARELVRLTKPGGSVAITTPNQLSLLSKMTLILRNEFNDFREGSYPAHLTALLEIDLRRIGAECGLVDIAVHYSGSGRLPLTSRKYPGFLSRALPRAFSDNVLIIGRKAER